MPKRGNPGVARGYLLYGLLGVREEKGVSRTELAARSGLNYVTLWRLESCKFGATPHTVSLISEALGVPEEQLRGNVHAV